MHLPMQETQVWPLFQEDPTCRGATEAVHLNYGGCALEPGTETTETHLPWRAHTPQQEKPRQWETQAQQLEKSLCSNKGPAEPKINKF